MRLIDEPNLEIGLAPEQRTLILKLNGGPDELVGARARQLRRQRGRLHRLPLAVQHVGIAARRARGETAPEPVSCSSGYELDEWNLRVFLRRLWGEERFYQSWAIDATPNHLTAEQWRQLGVSVIEETVDESLDELRRRLSGKDGSGVVV